MSDPIQDSPLTEPDSLFSRLDEKNWYEIVTRNHDELSSAYIDLVAEFATLLKESLHKNPAIQSNLEIALRHLAQLRTLLPEAIKVLETAEIHPSGEATHEEIASKQEDIICSIFSRVLDIFHKNNRTVNDLYQDMDINKDGKIQLEEMRSEFVKYDSSITFEETQTIFDILDGNKDGTVSLHELSKRMKYIEEKAEQERVDPLACLVISKPLDPALIHGNLSVMLIKGEGFKSGTHSVRIRVPDFLEYLTPETIETNYDWNYRADFMFENRTEKDLPLLIEIDLINKNKVEGSGSLQWKKAMNCPNEFSVKSKVLLKTSSGQSRGTVHFQIMWTPVIVRVYTEEELEKMRELERAVTERKKVVGELKEKKKPMHALSLGSIEEPEEQEEIKEDPIVEEDSLIDSTPTKKNPTDPKGYFYVVKTRQILMERIIKKRNSIANTRIPYQETTPIVKKKTFMTGGIKNS